MQQLRPTNENKQASRNNHWLYLSLRNMTTATPEYSTKSTQTDLLHVGEPPLQEWAFIGFIEYDKIPFDVRLWAVLKWLNIFWHNASAYDEVPLVLNHIRDHEYLQADHNNEHSGGTLLRLRNNSISKIYCKTHLMRACEMIICSQMVLFCTSMYLFVKTTRMALNLRIIVQMMQVQCWIDSRDTSVNTVPKTILYRGFRRRLEKVFKQANWTCITKTWLAIGSNCFSETLKWV